MPQESELTTRRHAAYRRSSTAAIKDWLEQHHIIIYIVIYKCRWYRVPRIETPNRVFMIFIARIISCVTESISKGDKPRLCLLRIHFKSYTEGFSPGKPL